VIPEGSFIEEKADKPSNCDPERKKEVSAGPAVVDEVGRQPSVEDISVEPGGHEEQDALP
jgi:hypothetical protein